MATPTTWHMILDAATAAQLMTWNPVSIRQDASLADALALFSEKGFSAAPVIDEAGRPVGVLSKTDLLLHERQQQAGPGQSTGPELEASTPPSRPTCVDDLMTPTVFSVTPDTPAARVVEQMVAVNVHHLFVVDLDGVLIGVISSMDVLRHLH